MSDVDQPAASQSIRHRTPRFRDLVFPSKSFDVFLQFDLGDELCLVDDERRPSSIFGEGAKIKLYLFLRRRSFVGMRPYENPVAGQADPLFQCQGEPAFALMIYFPMVINLLFGC